MISVDDLPAELRGGPPAPRRGRPGRRSHRRSRSSKRRYIRRVLERAGGNVRRAAAVLGVERRSLYRMLQRYGIEHKDRDGD